MKKFKFSFVALLLGLGAMLGGCSLNSQKNSAIPWSRPANWEGQIPGMGTTGGGGGGLGR